jgi:hypothetical protein
MKNFKVWLLVLPLFTVACSNDLNITEEVGTTTTYNEKKSLVDPDNSLNPYDYTGRIHNDILKTLDELDLNYTSAEQISSIIDSVAAEHPEVPSPAASLSGLATEISWMAEDDGAFDDVLLDSSLGSTAKSSLSGFMDSLIAIIDGSYEEIYSMIVLYEDLVLANTGFTVTEKRIILTTTSVARFSFHRKKRKDKDWETSVGSYAGTVYGAQEDAILGLKLAAAVGVYQNNLISE